eukprot:gene22655-25664_t
MLNLERVEANKLVYSYPPLIDEGTYFVEILALQCAAFDPENFVGTCLDPVADGVKAITLPYKFRVKENEASVEKRPRWVLTDKNQTRILPTRYQLSNCPSEANSRCPSKLADLWQHELYEWADRPNLTQLVQDVSQLGHKGAASDQLQRTQLNVCLIGNSHSHMLTLQEKQLELKNVRFLDVESQLPEEFEVNWLEKYQCNYAVIGYGQSLISSNTTNRPYTQTKYEQEMRRVMTLLQKYDQNKTQVFIRSVNYTPLTAQQITCPPTDYRTPPVIDMYNSVIRRLAHELSVEYIDVTPVMGPMWDSALDWSHPTNKVATAEIELILAQILQSRLQRHHVVLNAPEFPEFSLIRFADTAQVYVYQGGFLRTFPNGRTFRNMGYEFEDVKVLGAERRKEFKIGKALPSL